MKTSAIILAGGSSSRFGVDKGQLTLAGRPLIQRVLESLDGLVDEKIVVVSSEAQAKTYSKKLDTRVSIIVDSERVQTPLNGAMTGLENAKGAYSLLLACDTPFISGDVLSLLLELSAGKAAVIPRWSNGQIEPLQAVYCTGPALQAARIALNEGRLKTQAMVDKLRGIRYVSTLVLQQLDPELNTFFNVNTPADLKRAESMFGKRR